MKSSNKISNLNKFEIFLRSRIPNRNDLFVGDLGLRRSKYFMKLLGNPQDKINVIHVAGTSGKGSTCYILSHILESQGFQVGLSISPHVLDIRERMQINNKLPSEKVVLKYFNQIMPIIKKMEKTKYGSPTFFEINVGLAFYIFYKEKLDYAIIETGLGGILDGTNTVSNKNKMCLITKIGLDHTEILGKTISEIAMQKTGIIKDGNTVFATQQTKKVSTIISRRCKDARAKNLYLINKNSYKVLSSTASKTIFNFRFKDFILKNLSLELTGEHQAENCSLALAALVGLSERNKFRINEDDLRRSLKKISIPGRFEIIKKGKNTIIIDGAHNPQKMGSFIKSLSIVFQNQKFNFIVTFKKGKEYKGMLKKIIPLASKILLIDFSIENQDNHQTFVENNEICRFLKSIKFNNFQTVEKKTNPLGLTNSPENPTVITGSLYIVKNIRKHIKNLK